jgi:hypothetical protein
LNILAICFLLLLLIVLAWPGVLIVVWNFLAILLRKYDSRMFAAKDAAKDPNNAPAVRIFSKVQHGLLLYIPLTIIIILFVIAEFGRFFKPLYRVLWGTP